MITVIIRRTDEPKVIHMTQNDLAKQLDNINGAEVLLEDSWRVGLQKVRTPYVCLIEPDCVFSASYFVNNVGIMKKTNAAHGGGNTKVAMLSSCLGIRDFGNRIYNFELDKVKVPSVGNMTSKGEAIQIKSWHIRPFRDKLSLKVYPVQVGWVPGAIIRTTAIKDLLDEDMWDDPDLLRLSTALSFYFWDTNRRIHLNSNTTYVTNEKKWENPPLFDVTVPTKVANIFHQELIGYLAT